MGVRYATRILRGASLAGLCGVLAFGMAPFTGTTAKATEILSLKKVISIPGGGKITSFDIGLVDPTTNLYVLADRTNNAVDVVDTVSNTIVNFAGSGLFAGAAPGGSSVSGPNGVMIVRSREIWASDGDGSIKFLTLYNHLQTVPAVQTASRQKALNPLAPVTRADEMCYDPVHNAGFVAIPGDGAATTAPLIVRIDFRTHSITGQLNFDGVGGGGMVSPSSLRAALSSANSIRATTTSMSRWMLTSPAVFPPAAAETSP